MKKDEIIKCAIQNAKKYRDNLENNNIMFIYENKYNKAMEFYKLATIGKLNIKNITIKKSEIIDLKMRALNSLMSIDKFAKMIGNYNNTIKDALYTEKVSGTIHYCLGFVKSRDKKYYIPNTTLSQNILDNELRKNIDIKFLNSNLL